MFNASSKSSNGTSCQAWQSPTVPLLRKRCCELVSRFNLWQTPFNLICLHNINMRARTSTPPGCMTRRAKVRGQRGRTANWSGKHISPGGYSYTHIQYTHADTHTQTLSFLPQVSCLISETWHFHFPARKCQARTRTVTSDKPMQRLHFSLS